MDFFEAQARAKRRTRRLMMLFVLAVIGVIVACYLAALIVMANIRPTPDTWFVWDGGLFSKITIVVCALTGGAMLIKWLQLRSGGAAIAEMVGGRRVDPQNASPDERRLLNIVEEMSIASGVPVPAVYLLDGEFGLNAFAAGLTTSDAVVAVTRGSLEKLSRDELQGVVAHEFSHILNGDMRLNVRLTAVLFGILVLGLLGRGLLRVSFSGRGEKKGSIVFVVLAIGMALLLIGYVGYFLGRIIQAAISRQREFLADAAAVQFTRNPLGIGGALKKIGGDSLGSQLIASDAAQIGHFFFSQSFTSHFTQVWATHPPLEQRIRTIDPSWDGKFLTPSGAIDRTAENTRKRPAPPSISPLQGRGFAPAEPPVLRPFAPASSMDQAGTLTEAHFLAAQSLLDQIPPTLRTAARTGEQAPALVYCLLLDRTADIRARQLALIAQHDAAASAFVSRLEPDCTALAPSTRLPLLQLCLPALRFADANAAQRFLATLDQLIHADNQVTPFEFALKKMIGRQLQLVHAPVARVDFYSFNAVATDIAVILSTLARLDGDGSEDAANRAFATGVTQLKSIERQLALLDLSVCSPEALDRALDRLAVSSLPIKKRTLIAAAYVIGHDGTITPEEDELFRAISAALDVPLPAAA